jgi:cytochrome c peroxidase
VYEGSIDGLFGNRKPPSSAYATPSPIFGFDIVGHPRLGRTAVFSGGNFWDGRATGEKLGNPAADQAQGPFLNPVEQALPDSACVVYRVCTAAYPVTFEEVYPGGCDIAFPSDIDSDCAAGNLILLSDEDRAKSDTAYDNIALAIAAYEGSSESNAYSSKYDAYLAGQYTPTRLERQGFRLFRGKGKCANCHTLDAGPNGEPPLFTDFTFDNLGVPPNPLNPFYDMPPEINPAGENWLDLGLGNFLASRVDYEQYAPENYGKHKVATLRNVDLRPYPTFVKAFSHNGFFKSLKSIVHFYNTRDAKPSCESLGIVDATEDVALLNDCWPEPEISVNLNTMEMGDLGLTDAEEDAIVVFLKTLSDGFTAPLATTP